METAGPSERPAGVQRTARAVSGERIWSTAATSTAQHRRATSTAQHRPFRTLSTLRVLPVRHFQGRVVFLRGRCRFKATPFRKV